MGIFDYCFETYNKRIADGIVCLSTFTKSRALSIGISEKKTIIIHGGSDVYNINFYQDSNSKESLGLRNDQLTFGIINIEDEECEDVAAFFKVLNSSEFYDKIACITFGKKLTERTKLKFNLGNNFVEIGWIDYAKQSYLLSYVDFF